MKKIFYIMMMVLFTASVFAADTMYFEFDSGSVPLNYTGLDCSYITGETSGDACSIGAGAGTLYYAGLGLTLNGTNFFSVTPSYMLPQACGNGQVAAYNTTSLVWDCVTSAGTGTVTSVTRGFGFNNTGTSITTTGTLNVNRSVFQQRVSPECAAGSSIRAISINGSVTCETDSTIADTNTDCNASGSCSTNGVAYMDYANTGNFNLSGNLTMGDHWLSQEGNSGLHLTDDGTDLTLHGDIGGVNSFTIATDGTFFEMVANPGVANGYLMVAITETQGADTNINFYEGGTGHNRFWDSGSARFGGAENYLCSEITSVVDCDTAGTGADIVVQDDGWFGGALYSSNWGNATITESQVTDLTHTVDTHALSMPASNVTAGTFGSGNYAFPGHLNMTNGNITNVDNLYQDKQCWNTACTVYTYYNTTSSQLITVT